MPALKKKKIPSPQNNLPYSPNQISLPCKAAPSCLRSVANDDVHRASNAKTTNGIPSHTDGQSQSMKTLEARGNDMPANTQAATKLTFQVTDIRMYRYFALSDPHTKGHSYSTLPLLEAACGQHPEEPKT